MFVQFRPWKACDRNCDFCYLKDEKRQMDSSMKKKSLMELNCILHGASTNCDTIGLIGGELFDTDDQYREWFCIAETIHNSDDIKRVFVGTHLLCDMDALLDFAGMCTKEVQICTSYDSKGRFKDISEYEQWLENIKEVQKEGIKVVVSTTLTDSFMQDKDFTIPDGVDFKLQPYFISEEWLEDVCERVNSSHEYNAELKLNANRLPKRADVLKWYAEHPDIARDFGTYDDKHATFIWDWDGEKYVRKSFLPKKCKAPCGHPYLAFCYADSDKCSMCDAKEVSENVN